MDKKILAIIVVVIVAIAGVGGYLLLKDDKPSSDGTYAVSIDGVAATEDNVTNNTYKIQRNLIVCIKGELENAPYDVQNFLNYVTSADGQAVLAEEFVPLPESEMTQTTAPTQEISLDISGSTTIEPIMNKLVEAYTAKYADAGVTIRINVSGGGSGVGASNAASGQSDIGMCSRDLKDEETAQGLSSVQIGRDGVAVIVNNAGVKNLTLEQVAKIYSGEITNWKEIGGNDKAIAVIARDDASGTRECFDEKMEAALPGWKMKAGVPEHNSTGAVLTQVKNTEGAIGYVSIGALKDLEDPTTYAVDVDSVEATEDNVTNGTYKIQRNLIVCIKGELSEAPYAVQNFLNYVTSEKGQAVLAEEFVPLSAGQMTDTVAPTQDIILDISGSTTIEPIMNKLVEAYEAEYKDAGVTIRITVSGGGSGVGASNAASGQSDIGMCSRDLKTEEEAQGLKSIQIGRDGVAVIVNNAGVENLTLEQIAKIYSGEITNWNQVGGNDKLIAVIARDDSSGTRECFDEKMEEALEGWEMKTGVPEQNSTGAVLNQVQNTEGAIGYVSIGALKDL